MLNNVTAPLAQREAIAQTGDVSRTTPLYHYRSPVDDIDCVDSFDDCSIAEIVRVLR